MLPGESGALCECVQLLVCQLELCRVKYVNQDRHAATHSHVYGRNNGSIFYLLFNSLLSQFHNSVLGILIVFVFPFFFYLLTDTLKVILISTGLAVNSGLLDDVTFGTFETDRLFSNTITIILSTK